MSKGIPNPGVLTPGGEWPTHPAPASTQSAKPRFLSTELNWKRIWKGVRWPILAMIILYGCGFSIEVGPSMNHLGWIYITKWGSLPTQSGQIIRLAPADLPWWRKYVLGSQVKRFTGRQGNLYGYEGDNADWSADNRDGLKPVPADHIAGVVVAAWSPARMLNCLTPSGRLRNSLSLNYSPASICTNDKMAAAWSPVSKSTKVFVDGVEKREFKGWSIKSGWKGTLIVLGRQISGWQWEYLTYDLGTNSVITPATMEGNPVQAPSELNLANMQVRGGLVFALDETPTTKWTVGASEPHKTASQITFNKPFKGTLKVAGRGSSGNVLRIFEGSRMLYEIYGPDSDFSLELDGVHSIEFQITKMDRDVECFSWEVASVSFD